MARQANKFSVTKLPSGSWRALIRRKGIKPISQTFATEKLAIAYANEKVRQLDEVRAVGKMTAPRGATVGDYIEAYLEFVQAGRQLQRSALFIYKSLVVEFGKIGIHSLSSSHLESFIEKRKASGVQGQTIAGDLSLLSSVLRYCKDTKHLDIDAEIADQARKGIKTKHKMRIKSKEVECIPSSYEIASIIADYDFRKKQVIDMPEIIRFALATSMRQKEICSILIEDINHEMKTVVIRDRKHPTEKIGNNETVPLLPEAWEIVVRRIGKRKSGRIFPYNEKSVSTSYSRARESAGVTRPTRFHDLRHKAVTNFFDAGMSVPQVALMSGHKDWQTLKRYTHVTAADVHKAFDTKNGGGSSDAMQNTLLQAIKDLEARLTSKY